MIEDYYFDSAINLDMHPMRNAKKKIKEQYFGAMIYFLGQIDMTEHIKCRLAQYKDFLAVEDQDEQKSDSHIKKIIMCRFAPWKNKYKFWLICDIALIVIDYGTLNKVVDAIKELVSTGQKKSIDDLMKMLLGEQEDIKNKYWVNAKSLIEQYKKNCEFLSGKERKIIVTANMSAGKSTLINAIMGIDLARTSQEVCTGNISYYHNKAFHDGNIHLNGDYLEYLSDYQRIKEIEWNSPVSIAANFTAALDTHQRICIIDTPGVNSTIKREHGRIAKKCILEEKYDVLLYVLNANKLGTDEEVNYLKWISRNVPKEKLIFVVNKLDDFRAADDDIGVSINGVCNDLKALGYENPIVYPISAYFAYLVKNKYFGFCLSEDEEDEYLLYSKKFNKSDYNLAKFNGDTDNVGNDYEGMLKRSGLYYLEKLIYGGAL